MNISIFGLGYVGCVSAGCLVKDGHNIIGVDIDTEKVELINKGIPTVHEKNLPKLIADGVEKKSLFATTDYEIAVKRTDVSIITVGTPQSKDGSLDLSYLEKTVTQISTALLNKKQAHHIIIRSTINPGTCKRLQEKVHKITKNESHVIICNPEFLREGSAVHDYNNPPVIIIGTFKKKLPKKILQLYEGLNSEVISCDIHVAEIMKYVNNTFHALKIVFANEVGNICQALNINGHEVMELLCKDEKLNISPYYLKPGFPYGGSCLPKDLSGMKMLSKLNGCDSPVINNIGHSNKSHEDQIVKKILELNIKSIGVYGIAFKSGTDDLRNSPAISICERLYENDIELFIYDENVQVEKLIGQNKTIYYSSTAIKNCFLNDFEKFINNSDTILINTNTADIILKNYPNKKIITYNHSIKKHYDNVDLLF